METNNRVSLSSKEKKLLLPLARKGLLKPGQTYLCPYCSAQARAITGKNGQLPKLLIMECCRGPAPSYMEKAEQIAHLSKIEAAIWMVNRWSKKRQDI